MGTVCCWAAPRHIFCLPRGHWGTERHAAGATEGGQGVQALGRFTAWVGSSAPRSGHSSPSTLCYSSHSCSINWWGIAKNKNHLGILASTVNVEITTSWDHQKWHQYNAGRGKDMRVNLMGLTEKGPQSWGTAAAISQEAQGRGQGKTLPCAYRELVVQLVGEQRVRELPEVHLAEGAHAVNVTDGQLWNLLRLKFTPGEEDTKWLRKRKASKSHPTCSPAVSVAALLPEALDVGRDAG